MVRHRSLLPALALAAGLGSAVLAVPAPASAAPADGDAPLAVTIGELTPSTLSTAQSATAQDSTAQNGATGRNSTTRRRDAPIRVTGTVTNRDEETWTGVNLFPFVSATPMTTAAEVAAAAETEPEALVGDRLIDRGPYATITDLAPGETATYTLRIPRSDLPDSAEGVYWFGVHALGAAPSTPSDGLADGRARTFLPLVDVPRGPGGRVRIRPADQVRTALVVPVRRAVRYEADGSVAGVAGWARALDSQGPLRSLLDLGRSAEPGAVTWLVDPAVVDAVAQLAAGNPERSLAPTLDVGGTDPDSETPAPVDASSDPTVPVPTESAASDDDDDASEELTEDELAAQAAARSWLDDLRPALEAGPVLTLPYADLDVAAAASVDPEVYQRARARTGAVLRAWEIASTPAVVPPSGYLDEPAVDLTAAEETVVVSDEMVTGTTATVASIAGRRVVVSSAAAARGGPGPDDRGSAVGVRQRVLAEAAVRRLGTRDPLVVVLPSTWAPTSAGGFFAGLDVPWLDAGTLDEATTGPAEPVAAEQLRYPAEQTEAELGPADFAAAGALTATGRTLQNVLTLNDEVASVVAGEALTGVSVHSRTHPMAARERAVVAQDWIDDELDSIEVAAPPQVTLSSTSGRFSVTLTNGLDQPVTVALAAYSDEPIDIEVPQTVELGPRSRRSVLLVARTEQQGIHNITLAVTDLRGTGLGVSAQLPVRAAQVSSVIWVIIGSGIALLAGAGGLRLARGLRRSRAQAARDADDRPDGQPDGEADQAAAVRRGPPHPSSGGSSPDPTPEDTPA